MSKYSNIKFKFPRSYRLLARLRFLFSKEIVYTGIHGLKIFINKYSFTERLISGGNFEMHRLIFLEKSLAKPTQFIDIGANIGYFSIFAEALGASVEAFEPEPFNLKRFRRNLTLNDRASERIRIHEFALGAAEGEITLGRPLSDNYGHASIVSMENCDQIKVPLRRFDSLGILNGECVVVKIDVEGAEELVLAGFESCWTQIPKGSLFVIEVHRQFGANLAAIEALLKSKGYEISFLNDETGEITLRAPDGGDVCLLAQN